MSIRSGIIIDSITRVKEYNNVAIAEISCDGNNISNVRNIPLFPSIGAAQNSETNNNNTSDVIDNRAANGYFNAPLYLIFICEYYDLSTSFILFFLFIY